MPVRLQRNRRPLNESMGRSYVSDRLASAVLSLLALLLATAKRWQCQLWWFKRRTRTKISDAACDDTKLLAVPTALANLTSCQ